MFAAALGAVPAGAATTQRPAQARGTTVVPDHFLRRWDPVTVFFAQDTGPAGGGAEDHPERFVKVTPAHPGGFTWIDARTLQFRPAEPWPPLASFTWTAGKTSAALITLMAAPIATEPADDAVGLDAVESITLTFPEPIDAALLAKMIAIELRPLPGVGGNSAAAARWLGAADFELKTIERAARDERATYVLQLTHPIALGMHAVVRLRLSLDDRTGESFAQFGFATAEPFRLTAAGCRGSATGRQTFPVTPEGSRYASDQAINCGADSHSIVIEFSAAPRDLGPVEARGLVRLTPPVDGLQYKVSGTTLEITGSFASETLYRVALTPAAISDGKNRALQMTGESELYVYFPSQPAYLNWNAAAGIIERYGMQMVPLRGRGDERLDLRIYAIDPFDRSFWPFPEHALTIDESRRPPGPGEEPDPYTDASGTITPNELSEHIRTLGSPPISQLVELPLRRANAAASFGLDLSPYLTRLAGKNRPGSYLVGIRRLDRSAERSWMRVQATDLSLSTVEEPFAVHFVVTSLSTARPVPNATVKVEGAVSAGYGRQWETLVSGTTDADGTFVWPAPGPSVDRTVQVRRISVQKDDDVVVFNAVRPPDWYRNNRWRPSRHSWLQWAFETLDHRGAHPETLCHIFTERPIYRPEDEVHIKGYVRWRERGRLSPVQQDGFVVVEGPGEDQKWKYPVTLTPEGSFYYKFQEPNPPTGQFHAHYEDRRGERPSENDVPFRLEAYRIPTFEVQLHADDHVPLDREFGIGLTATYYAGGKVAARPVQWRVTQFPYTWEHAKRDGFFYSSDGRFSPGSRFESSPRLEKQDTTSDDGGAALTLNPALEPNAQPRTYVIEATVTGADDQTVTATRQVHALPPFVLGLKVPRYIERAKQIDSEIIVVGADANRDEAAATRAGTEVLLPGIDVKVTVLRRRWDSHLQASDFSDGKARYVTDVVDEKVSETTITSGTEPVKLALPVTESGVYVVTLESHDRMNRAQVVSVDLYAAGDEPVTWAKTPGTVFETTTDKDAYDPGTTAAIVLKSPFQIARALAIVEAPDGNRYEWVDVKGGSATFQLPVLNTYVPRVPVHFVLMRGRIGDAVPGGGTRLDLGKPATMAATAWVKVNPVDHRVNVALENPPKAKPGETIDVTVKLTDPHGNPLPGEVTLWLVDQAVLALGKEQRLDPLPDFITSVRTRLSLRDTRNLTFGWLPFAELPGGGEGSAGSLFDGTTVRRTFKAVPYYHPGITVGPDGIATVHVQLSDDLTNFKLRAKAISGPDRFGFATGEIHVRLPVIVQPALPRFVRPGDSFSAGAVARVIEGESGAGTVEMQTEGATVKESTRRAITWEPNRPARVDFPVDISTPPYNADGQLGYDRATFRVAVERTADSTRDAFEVKLPIRDDRQRVVIRSMEELQPGVPLPIPPLAEPARPGTVRRTVLLSDQPALVRMAAGLSFLLQYPYGCTEQRISLARAYIALRKFREVLHTDGSDERLQKSVRDVLQYLPLVLDSDNLIMYWPGAPHGYVSLTAWVVQFLVEARDAGIAVDQKLFDTLVESLERSLRSDYSHFIDGESFMERAWALDALAAAGKYNPGYAAELARRSRYLSLEGVSNVLVSMARAGDTTSSTVDGLVQELWDGTIIRLYQGNELYGGLQDRGHHANGLILPSETRTVAEMTRAITRTQSDAPRLQVLINALVTLGRDDGWGSTNANAAALAALADVLQPPFKNSTPRSIALHVGAEAQTVAIGPDAPLGIWSSGAAEGGEMVLESGDAGRPVIARVETSYVPLADGSQVAAQSRGFVVTRELQRIAKKGDAPAERRKLEEPGTVFPCDVGDVIEEHVQVVNPDHRNYVAIVVPLAAGMEPLNPNLATAPPEARPAGRVTREPTYVQFLDDRIAFYYDDLPKGTYDWFYRTRATTAGRFVQPAAFAEMMYDGSVRGNSPGARVEIGHAAE